MSIVGNSSSLDTVRSWEFLGDPTMRVPPSIFKAQSSHQSSTTESKKGGGFLSCGITGGGPTSGGPSSGLMLLLMLPMIVLIGLRFYPVKTMALRKS